MSRVISSNNKTSQPSSQRSQSDEIRSSSCNQSNANNKPGRTVHVSSRSRSNSIRSISSGRSRRSNHSNSGRSRSRSPLHDSRLHSNFEGSNTVGAPRSGINYLIKLMEKSNQIQVEHERRLNRMEVSINKTLILVGDMTRSNNMFAQPTGLVNRQIDRDSDMDIDEFDVPKMPIKDLDELFNFQKQLRNRRFNRFLVSVFC